MNVVRYTVGLFMFTLLFARDRPGPDRQQRCISFRCLSRPRLQLACFAAFLYLIDSASKLLRPITILTQCRKQRDCGH